MRWSRELMIDRMLRRDAACNGRFVVGVLTTGIFCLPSCGARKPKPENVRFFPGIEEARAAGLRPCKRCRPDLFYQDLDPDQILVEELVGRLRDDPASVGSVRDLAAGSGVGSSKLNLLFRRYYHTTPLELLSRLRIERACRELLHSARSVTEIGFDVGYETLSAFNENFRERTGLAPRRYRLLPGADRFVLELPAWFSPDRVLAYLGRDPGSPSQRVEGRVFRFAMADGPASAVVSVELARNRAECSIEPVSTPPSGGWGPAVHRRLLRLLGLLVDPRPFERRMARADGLKRLIRGRRGVGIPQTHDLVDGLIWVIVGQQVSLRVAFNLRRKLAEGFGRRVSEGFVLWPGLDTVAQLDYGALQEIGFSRRKAEYLIDLARSAADGRLDLAALAVAPATEIERRLLGIRGFGPWSVHYLMMRALALADCVPVGDVALAKSLAEFFALDARPGKRAVQELMEPFAPYRSLATFHLWSRLGDAQ